MDAYGGKNRVAFLRLLKFPKIETCLFFFSMVESADSDDIFLFGGSFSCKYTQNKVGPQKTVIKMGYNPYKWPKIHGQLGYNKPTYSRGSIYHPIYLSMVHQGGPPLFLGFLGGTIFGIRIHLSYRNQVLGYQSWQRSWCHLRLE